MIMTLIILEMNMVAILMIIIMTIMIIHRILYLTGLTFDNDEDDSDNFGD